MSNKNYWDGHDDFDYQGYQDPPRCDRGSTECRRAIRDYEDGYQAAERDREEQRTLERERRRRKEEEQENLERYWAEQRRQEELEEYYQ